MTFSRAVRALMARGVSEGVFPGAVLAVWHQGKTWLESFGWQALWPALETNHENIIYDLASLTKPLATTLLTMRLVAEERLSLEDHLSNYLGGPAWFREVRLHHLLEHCAGLPAHRPYFARLVTYPPKERPEILTNWILAEPLAYPVGYKQIYSDLGFYLLGRIVELVSGQGLAAFFEETLQTLFDEPPELFFLPREKASPNRIAPTELCPWRGKLLRGEVHDENTWAVGGVTGQAGLFGTAEAVLKLLVGLFKVYQGGVWSFLTPNIVRLFWDWGEAGKRALGFDRPSPKGSSAGALISPRAVGHLGFTGTSFWIDLENKIIVVLLSNRIHPSRQNEKIRAFRPALHELLWRELLEPGLKNTGSPA